ncbi:hypothetical protein BLEM_2192 [Bifidobacterium lemurum]|uniref:DUF6591 domain-containing protein n=1 Tax=Bifidobacterium lemurum TaxID=1603886 RepID=A0A261FLK2_9BIFI|nr:DUF6591 domain-containing protein [Bifidobacterium lemurum]OZG60017.1 hypothetical protein BLEM_2192 [Bifidobacterium lemurum]QOL34029.1 hypothetical protein BL8807_09815 [Bifidobacterium lemurum]
MISTTRTKITALLVASALTLTLGACGNSSSQITQGGSDQSSQSTDADAQPQTDVQENQSGDFKTVMDDYERFVDEYVAFMQRYNESDDPTSLLAEYGDMMQRLNDYGQNLSEFDGDSLDADDLTYYTEVMNRCNEKLASITQ